MTKYFLEDRTNKEKKVTKKCVDLLTTYLPRSLLMMRRFVFLEIASQDFIENSMCMLSYCSRPALRPHGL